MVGILNFLEDDQKHFLDVIATLELYKRVSEVYKRVPEVYTRVPEATRGSQTCT